MINFVEGQMRAHVERYQIFFHFAQLLAPGQRVSRFLLILSLRPVLNLSVEIYYSFHHDFVA